MYGKHGITMIIVHFLGFKYTGYNNLGFMYTCTFPLVWNGVI